MIYTIVTNSSEETLTFAARMAKYLESGDVIALYGDLGSGKTCFTQGVCRGLGVHEPVTSPTFTLINEYSNSMMIYHFDFYRIGSEDEIYGLGYEEYFYGNGICLIEWADRVHNFLPANRIEIYMENMFDEGKEFSRSIKINIIGNELEKRNWAVFFEDIHQEKTGGIVKSE